MIAPAVTTYVKDEIILELTEEVSELKIDIQHLEGELDLSNELLRQYKVREKSNLDSYDLLYTMYVDVINAKTLTK